MFINIKEKLIFSMFKTENLLYHWYNFPIYLNVFSLDILF